MFPHLKLSVHLVLSLLTERYSQETSVNDPQLGATIDSVANAH